jgi:hypothetical protein
MAIIEPYNMDHSEGPRPCPQSVGREYPSISTEKPCFAELILHTRSGEMLLCKRHAAQELRNDPTLLAEAVIELSLCPVTA